MQSGQRADLNSGSPAGTRSGDVLNARDQTANQNQRSFGSSGLPGEQHLKTPHELLSTKQREELREFYDWELAQALEREELAKMLMQRQLRNAQQIQNDSESEGAVDVT